jgi:hypothetical protein
MNDWRHRIKVEKTLEPSPADMLSLRVAGANTAPPDDCGGVYGYYNFVAAIGPQPSRARGDDRMDRSAMGRHRVRSRRCGLASQKLHLIAKTVAVARAARFPSCSALKFRLLPWGRRRILSQDTDWYPEDLLLCMLPGARG